MDPVGESRLTHRASGADALTSNPADSRFNGFIEKYGQINPNTPLNLDHKLIRNVKADLKSDAREILESLKSCKTPEELLELRGRFISFKGKVEQFNKSNSMIKTAQVAKASLFKKTVIKAVDDLLAFFKIDSKSILSNFNTSSESVLAKYDEVGTPGLPNFRGELSKVCYMNSALQMLANIPVLKDLIIEGKQTEYKQEASALKEDLVALLESMEKVPSSKLETLKASEKFWGSFQACCSAHKSEYGTLTVGKGKVNDSSEFLAYLGDMLAIPILRNISELSFEYIYAKTDEGAQIKDFTGDVFVTQTSSLSSDPSDLKGEIKINGQRFILTGVINYNDLFKHYTSTVRVGNDWVNHDDSIKSVVNERGRNISGPRVAIYVKEEEGPKKIN